MSRKRLALVLSGEETYPGASLGIVHQLQEFARYTHSDFVGLVRGVANSRGEVARDPADPIADCERLGRSCSRDRTPTTGWILCGAGASGALSERYLP